MAAKTCYYRFPCHPAEILSCSSKELSADTRILRVEMIKTIAELSQTFPQHELDNKVHIDLDDEGNIIGMDLSILIGLSAPLCFHSSIKLGEMTEDNWIHMKLYKAKTS